jgi:hypothetical protein
LREEEIVVRTYPAALALSVLSFGASGCSNLANTNAPFGAWNGSHHRRRGHQRVSIVLAGSRDHPGGPTGRLAQRRFRNSPRGLGQSVDRYRNLDPGAFSSSVLLEATGAYHCTIHPEMVGTIKGQ